ncbi:MAG: hypothetical protein JSR78_07185 [Proteobacteria bacterium]|nr:hypothetical protein [Pseudomonadota bacterium]
MPTIQELALTINEKIKSVFNDTFELANLCVNAVSSYEPSELAPLLEMDEGTFSKYRKVGTTFYLSNYKNNIPHHLSSLYALTFIPEEKLKDAIAQGKISSRSTRREIEDYCKLISGKAPSNVGDSILLRIRKPADYTDDEEIQLTKALRDVAERFRCAIGDVSKQVADPATAARNGLIVSNTMSIIAGEKKRRKDLQMKKPAEQRQDPWPFKEGDVKITKASTPEDCQRVLTTIGCSAQWDIISSLANSWNFDDENPAPSQNAKPKKAA